MSSSLKDIIRLISRLKKYFDEYQQALKKIAKILFKI